MTTATTAVTTTTMIRRRVLFQMVAGTTIVAIPIGAWWYRAQAERAELQAKFRHRIQLPTPGSATTTDSYDYIITEKCRPGDVVLFHRRCDRCAASPWSALACYATQYAFSSSSNGLRGSSRRTNTNSTVMNHCGIIVPGYASTKAQELDPTNLLLLEATPSGIVARPLKERLEQSTSHTILLLPVCGPGERRDGDTTSTGPKKDYPDELLPSVQRMHRHVQRELTTFRDQWIAAGAKRGYHHIHSTVTIGGAVAHYLGLDRSVAAFTGGPISPAAFLVLSGLQKAAIAMNTSDVENRLVCVSGFLSDYRRTDDATVVRLRPGYRFLPPLTLKVDNTLDD